MVEDLMVRQTHEVRIGIDTAAEPVNLSCRVVSSQFLLEAHVEAVKVVEERLLRGVAAVACAIEAEDDPPGSKRAKVILLNAAEMTKVLPEGSEMTTGTECEFGGFKGFQEVSG